MKIQLGAFVTGAILVCPTMLPAAEKPSFPEIYDSQKETIALLKPDEALKRMKLPPGFQATLFAGEPDVRQPIAMAFDARGRLWVAENYTYSEAAINFDTKLRDRIMIFEDQDGDGRFDKRTVFWDQAERLTSIAVGFGGVFATCPPYLLFTPDRNGDDVPDAAPEVLLDGFDHDQVRHTLANGLKFGPDGWLYGRHGIQATSLVGKPETTRENRTRVNGCIWRYHPTRRVFELVAQGTTNPWGSDWDEYGELFFINTVIGHLWHAIPGAYFKRMYGEPFNPHVYELIDQTADHVHWDTREAWNDVNKGISSTTADAGGGHAHAGLMMYLGDNWPEGYRNSLFTLNFHGKRINRDQLERQGAGYVGRHAPDFMSIDDPWFRGIELLYGPDGGVHVADWSDIGECHDSDGVHRTSGRIYRITYGQLTNRFHGDLSKLDNLELVRLQMHRNDWFVRQARQVLQERAARGVDMRDAHAALLRMFSETVEPSRKLRALWALYTSGGAQPGWLRQQLGASNEHLRVWAIRLLVDQQAPSADLISEFSRMAREDNSGLVLSYLASALQRIPEEQRWPLGLALASRAEFDQDRVLPLMVWYGIEPSVSKAPEKAVELVEHSALNKVRLLTTRRIFEDLNENARAASALVELLSRENRDRSDILQGVSAALDGRRQIEPPSNWSKVRPGLLQAADDKIRSLARELDARFGNVESQSALAALVADAHQEAQLRRRALDVLVQTKSDKVSSLLPRLIDDEEMGGAAIRAMAALAVPDTAQILIAKFPQLSPAARRQAIQALVSRSVSAAALLQAIQRGKIARQEIDASALRQLRNFRDSALQEKLSAIWPQSDASPNSTRELFARYKKLLTPEHLIVADLSRGRAVFQQACAPCHKLYGEGAQIGPELTGGDRHNLDYLLENILNPSGIVPESYRVSIVTMKDDLVLSGVVTAKTDETLSLQTATEKMSTPMSEVESIRESQLSMMPNGLLDALNDQQVTDLIGYLMSNDPPTTQTKKGESK